MPDFYTSKYPIISVTADVVLLNEKDEVLLIKRAQEPFKNCWALIGGFLDNTDEDLEIAAARECDEEVGYLPEYLKSIGTYSTEGRDPRGRTVTQAFLSLASSKIELNPQEGEVLEAKWFPISEPPSMAFDHKLILNDTIKLIRTTS